jgi:hypothetical protein
MMLPFIRGMALPLVVVLASCQGTPTPTASPTSSPAAETPSATPFVSPTPDPTQSQAATLAPTTTPTTLSTVQPTVEPPPTATVEPTFDPNVIWRVGQGIPAGATITAIAIRDPDFVVGGFVDAPTPQCPSRRDARMWGSADGADWYDIELEKAANARVDVIAASAYGLPAIGHRGSYLCRDDSAAVWHPTDKSDWFLMDNSGFPGGAPLAALGVGDHFVVTGDGRDPDRTGVWLLRVNFYEGAVFEAAIRPPERGGYAMESLAAIGDTVVGFTGGSTLPAWYSNDGGDIWDNSGLQPSYWFQSTDTAAGDGGFYAVGRACCVAPDEWAGALWASSDGRDWAPVADQPTFARPIETIVATPTGYIALGEQTYLSSDGRDWRLGPPLPGYDPDDDFLVDGSVSPYQLSAAVFGTKIVVVTPRGQWFASTTDLDADLWPREAPRADLPRVGQSVAGSVFTHCGVNGALDFGLRMWVPDDASLVDGDYPPSFDDLERGRFTLVTQDRLEFTNRRGVVLVYYPTDDPPESFACA